MKKILLLIIVLLIISGCLSNDLLMDEDLENLTKIKKKSQVGKITHMIYIAADNNLSSQNEDDNLALMDLEEIRQADIDDDNIEVLIMLDYYNSIVGHPYEKGLYVKRGKNLQKIQNGDFLYEINTGSGETLRNFINISSDLYPADFYILTIWGHGDGWFDDGTLGVNPAPSNAIALDKNLENNIVKDDWLDLWELEEGIQESLGFIDLVHFDACLMGGLEVSYQLKDVTSAIAFSPELVSGYGAFYTTLLEGVENYIVNETQKIDPIEVGIILQQTTFDSLIYGGEQQNGDYIEESVLAVVDQSKVEELVNKIENLITNKDFIFDLELDIYNLHKYYTEEIDNYYYDLGFLFNKMDFGDNKELQNMLEEIEEVYSDYLVINLVQNRIDSGRIEIDEEGSTGVSVLFLNSLNYKEKKIIDEYKVASSFGKDTSWVQFVQNIVAKIIYNLEL